MSDADRPLVVLQSFPAPRPTTNPYIVMLRDSLAATEGLTVRTWSWRTALFGRYDVVQVHWPEILVSGASPLKAAVRQLLFLAFLLRLRLTRTPLVRTVHNLELPSGISRREIALLRLAERWTALRIVLNPVTELPAGQQAARILHGSYREWFAAYPRAEVSPGRLAYAGLIRRYKGVEQLVTAFRQTAGAPGDDAADLTLTVAGKASTDELVDTLRTSAAGDERISFTFAYLDDAELVASITAGELVVLPYREMHNSGTTLAALSLDRPVLVPDNAVNRQLAHEVGPGWVHVFAGELTGQVLVDTLAALRAEPPVAPPDLGAREWADAGRAHLAAYRQARELVRARR